MSSPSWLLTDINLSLPKCTGPAHRATNKCSNNLLRITSSKISTTAGRVVSSPISRLRPVGVERGGIDGKQFSVLSILGSLVLLILVGIIFIMRHHCALFQFKPTFHGFFGHFCYFLSPLILRAGICILVFDPRGLMTLHKTKQAQDTGNDGNITHLLQIQNGSNDPRKITRLKLHRLEKPSMFR